MTLDRVTVSGGYLDGNGAGMYAMNCAVTITNCVVANNQTFSPVGSVSRYGGGLCLSSCRTLIVNSQLVSNRQSGAGLDGRTYGVGIYAAGGQLKTCDVLFQTNRADLAGYWYPYGGAIQCDGVAFDASNCVFNCNHVSSLGSGSDAAGGALFLNSGSAQIISCSFTGNYAQAETGSGPGVGRDSYGGAIQARNLTNLVLRACQFTGSFITGGGSQWGGTLYLSGSTGSVVLCDIVANGQSATKPGDIYIASGTVAMTNNLLAKNWGLAAGGAMNAGGGILLAGGTATVVNCTLADGSGWGMAPYTNGTRAKLTVRNCIVWGNAAGGINTNFSGAGSVSVDFNDSQESLAGVGNTNANPLFVDAAAGDYHEKSLGGSWHGGLWMKDSENSPCIDAGDASDPRWESELEPNGRRLNMGAYGGTAQASKKFSRAGAMFIIR